MRFFEKVANAFSGKLLLGSPMAVPVPVTEQAVTPKAPPHSDTCLHRRQIVRTVIRSLNRNTSDKEVRERGLPSHEDGIDQNVCRTRTKTIFPKTARSADGKWLYVINDAAYVQAITVEVCVGEGSPCDYVMYSGLPAGYSSTCKQKFAYRKLLTVHPTEQKAYAETFPFPTCCSCYVKSPMLVGGSPNPSRRCN
ncbi:protein spaetzle-like [Dermacentor variabilis]|uniref:protein spaetzle-like n=1 Tax=Dermacentor variabilis TaxID=34621 RepID=UPI003F5BEF2E